jgi:hypothetical protein
MDKYSNKIKGITTATDGTNSLAAKMLDYTLKYNLDQIDDILIVTDYKSPNVESVSKKYNIQCIKTDKFYENNATYDRGKVLSEILKEEKDGWILHLDSDILLPKDFKQKINQIDLDKNILYGSRRIIFETLKNTEEWFLKNGNPEELSNHIPYGYCWGYFQLFNMKSIVIERSNKDSIYPASGHIGDHDEWFKNKWGVMIEHPYVKGRFLPGENDLKVMGNIRELPFLVGHLGVPSVNNKLNDSFFD